MRMLKKALIAYVNSMKAIWSVIAHPLSIVSKRKGMLKGYRVYGNSVQDGEPTPENPIEVQSVGELTTKNIFNIDGCLNECLIKNDDGTYTLQKTASNRFSATVPMYIPVNTSIALGVDVVDCKRPNSTNPNVVMLQAFYADGTNERYNFYDNKITSSSYHVWSVPKDMIKASLYLSSEDAVGDYITFKNLQIEIGEERTPCEPYHKYKVPVTVRGKNLFDKDSTEYMPINCLLFETNGSLYTIQGRLGAFECASSGGELKIPFLQNFPIGTYTVSMFVTLLETGEYGSKMRIYMGKTEESTSIRYQRTFSVGEKTKISFTNEFAEGFGGMKIMLNSCKWEIDVSSIQIEESSEATPYEPYIEPQTHNIYLDEPLRKIGDYADCIDGEKSVVLRKCCKKYLKDYNNWAEVSDYNESVWSFSAIDNSIIPSVENQTGKYLKLALSNMFPIIATNIAPNVSALMVFTYARNVRLYLSVECLEDNTVASLTKWLAEYDPYMIRVLATPTEEPIELPKLPQFKGTTIYEVQADITPSGMEVCYYE